LEIKLLPVLRYVVLLTLHAMLKNQSLVVKEFLGSNFAIPNKCIERSSHRAQNSKVYHWFILDVIFKSNWLLLLDLIYGRKTGGYIDISWIPKEPENLC